MKLFRLLSVKDLKNELEKAVVLDTGSHTIELMCFHADKQGYIFPVLFAGKKLL